MPALYSLFIIRALFMLKLLFVCTHNRCRSILAEAIANQTAGDVFEVKSAGSQPAGVVFPGTIQFLKSQGIDTRSLSSESWDVHESFKPDVVITVCDSAAGETCPLWMGKSIRIHWGLQDPSKLPENEQTAVFEQVSTELRRRINYAKESIKSDMSITQITEIFESAVTG